MKIKKTTSKEMGTIPISLDNIIDKVLLTLLVSLIFLFILYPIVMVISKSFILDGKFSLLYLKDLLSSKNVYLIKNSLFVTIQSSIYSTIIGICISLYMYLKNSKESKVIQKILILSMISPPFVSSIALITLFGRRGLITYNLLGLSSNIYGWKGIVLLQTLGGVPLSVLIIYSALTQIDSRLINASKDLGATFLSRMRKIILPLISSSLLSVLFLNFTRNFADYGTPIIIGGKYKMLATETYNTIFTSGNLGKASAMCILMIPPAIIAFYFYSKSMRSKEYSSDGREVYDIQDYSDVPKVFLFTLGLVTYTFIVITILKYGTILLTSITNNSSGKLKFTLKYIKEVRFMYKSSLLRSLLFAIIAAFLSSIMGVLISYYIKRRKIYKLEILELISNLPYVIPGIFFGLGYVVAFNDKPFLLTGTSLIIILNSAFRHISVSNKAANSLFSSLDLKVELAAKDLGASDIQVLISIIFPLVKPAFLTSFIHTFTACMTTVGPLIFLVSPKNVVASIVMFKDIERGGYNQAAVIATSLIILTLACNILFSKLLDLKGEK